MLDHGGQWIQWKRNPPTASNIGVWECQIRSARSVLIALLKIHATSLNDESLWTFLAKVEAIVNTKPITSESLSDVHSPAPLCPMQLLTMKSRVVMPLPDISCQWLKRKGINHSYLKKILEWYLLYGTDPPVRGIICRLGFHASSAQTSVLVVYCMGSFLLVKPVDQQRKQLAVRFYSRWSGVGILTTQIRLTMKRVVET